MRTYKTLKEVKEVMRSFAITWDVLTGSTMHVNDMDYYIKDFAELQVYAKMEKFSFTEKYYIREHGVESVKDRIQKSLQCIEVGYNHIDKTFSVNAYKL